MAGPQDAIPANRASAQPFRRRRAPLGNDRDPRVRTLGPSPRRVQRVVTSRHRAAASPPSPPAPAWCRGRKRCPAKPASRPPSQCCSPGRTGLREVDWPAGERRFPGELRLPGVACIVRVHACIERAGKTHEETRYYVSSATLDAERAGQAVRVHRGIENRLRWDLDVTFADDQSHLRKDFGPGGHVVDLNDAEEAGNISRSRGKTGKP